MEGNSMISKSQLQGIAKKNKIGLYYQEKDYLLNIFLYSLHKITDRAVFKGGTCLKLAYNYMRFSEDLDFNTDLSQKKTKEIVDKVLKSFELLGINRKIMKEELFENSYTIKIKFEGPLYTGRAETTNAISIDIGIRGKVMLMPLWKQIISPYTDVPNYFVRAMREEEIIAEKIRTLIMRSEPRDLFDVYSMLSKGVAINKKILRYKLKEVGIKKFSLVFCNKKQYKGGLSNLLPYLPDYEDVVNFVKSKLRGYV